MTLSLMSLSVMDRIFAKLHYFVVAAHALRARGERSK